MPTTSSVFLASLLIAVPAVSVGVHYLSPSSTSGQEQVNETPVVEPVNAEKPDIKVEEPSVQPAPQPAPQPAVSKEIKSEIAQSPQKPWLDEAKNKLTGLNTAFPYEKLLDNFTGRLSALENFVKETDNVRNTLKNTISKLLEQQENKGKSWKDIFEKDLTLKLIPENENSTWDKLAKFRKEEAEAQVDLTESLAKTQNQAEGTEVTPEDISKFCKDPKAENSHLGMYDLRRKTQEETEDYRFFTYYSYCTKDSFYLSDKLVFEKKS